MLLVSNLGPHVSEDDLRMLFEDVGPVKFARRHYNIDDAQCCDWAVVVFERNHDVQVAIREFSGIPLDGLPLNLEEINSDCDSVVTKSTSVQTDKQSKRTVATQTLKTEPIPKNSPKDVPSVEKPELLPAGLTAEDVLKNFHDHFGNWEGFYKFLGSALGKTASSSTPKDSTKCKTPTKKNGQQTNQNTVSSRNQYSQPFNNNPSNHMATHNPPQPCSQDKTIGILKISCIQTGLTKNCLFHLFKQYGRVMNISDIVVSQHEFHLCGGAYLQFMTDMEASWAIQGLHMFQFAWWERPLIVGWGKGLFLDNSNRMPYTDINSSIK